MRGLALVTVLWLVLGASTTSATSNKAFPLVTLNGIGGVRPDTPLGMMRARWQVPLPAVVQNGGSEGSAYVPICVGRVHGVAGLSGPTGLGSVDKLFGFDWAVFTAGIYTDAGITIGSTADELGKAYGRRLGGTEFERRIISAKAPRTTIVFSIKDHRVTAIGFGRRGAVDVRNWVSAC